MAAPGVGASPVNRNPVVPLVYLVAVAVLLAACSASTGGVAAPTSPSTTAESAGTPGSITDMPSHAGDEATRAPTVATPLNASAFLANPCSALTISQLTAITLTDLHTLPNSTAGNPLCTWVDQSSSDSVGVDWMPSATDGLSQVYAQRPSQGYFVPTTVGHYPAVYADFADLRAQGTCSLNVGVSNTLYFFVKYDSEQAATRQQACQLTAQAAADVIRNLGGL